MSMTTDREELKAALFDAMCGNGGVYEVLDLLQELFLEASTDCRDIREDVVRSAVWFSLSQRMRRAKERALPLINLAK
jgi:hypothetical protein